MTVRGTVIWMRRKAKVSAWTHIFTIAVLWSLQKKTMCDYDRRSVKKFEKKNNKVFSFYRRIHVHSGVSSVFCFGITKHFFFFPLSFSVSKFICFFLLFYFLFSFDWMNFAKLLALRTSKRNGNLLVQCFQTHLLIKLVCLFSCFQSHPYKLVRKNTFLFLIFSSHR